MRKLLLLLLLAGCPCRPSCAADGPPRTVTLGGEELYVTGHAWTVRAVRSGSWINPHCWEPKRVPTSTDRVWIPPGVVSLWHGDIEAATIVCEGSVEVLHGTHVRCSSILGLPAATFRAGSAATPVGWRWEYVSRPFESGDSKQFGNGFVWCGHGGVAIYGAVDESGPWANSNGERGDTWISDGPGDAMYSVPLGSSIEWTWAAGDIPPHVMLFHGSGHLENVTVYGFGRSDLSRPSGSDNRFGRFAFHAHRGLYEHRTTLKRFVSVGSPGWGIDIHNSWADVSDCVVANCFSGAFVDQPDAAGTSKGEFRNCTAIGVTSRLKPQTADRQAVGDSFFSGEALGLGGVGMKVTGLTALDCGIGISAISARNHHEPQPIHDCFVSGYDRFGAWLSRRGTARSEDTLLTVSDCGFYNGGPAATGLLAEYDQGYRLVDCEFVGCDVGIKTHNTNNLAIYDGCVVGGCRIGYANLYTSWGDYRINGGTIDAAWIGVENTPVQHPAAKRILRINGTTLNAPVPLRLVGTPPPGVVNEVWINDEHHSWP